MTNTKIMSAYNRIEYIRVANTAAPTAGKAGKGENQVLWAHKIRYLLNI